MEPLLSSLLEPLKETAQLAPRLGAQDTKNSTHLLRITDQQAILNLLKKAVPELLQLTSDLVP